MTTREFANKYKLKLAGVCIAGALISGCATEESESDSKKDNKVQTTDTGKNSNAGKGSPTSSEIKEIPTKVLNTGIKASIKKGEFGDVLSMIVKDPKLSEILAKAFASPFIQIPPSQKPENQNDPNNDNSNETSQDQKPQIISIGSKDHKFIFRKPTFQAVSIVKKNENTVLLTIKRTAGKNKSETITRMFTFSKNNDEVLASLNNTTFSFVCETPVKLWENGKLVESVQGLLNFIGITENLETKVKELVLVGIDYLNEGPIDDKGASVNTNDQKEPMQATDIEEGQFEEEEPVSGDEKQTVDEIDKENVSSGGEDIHSQEIPTVETKEKDKNSQKIKMHQEGAANSQDKDIRKENENEKEKEIAATADDEKSSNEEEPK